MVRYGIAANGLSVCDWCHSAILKGDATAEESGLTGKFGHRFCYGSMKRFTAREREKHRRY
jgi:hypothetical protein